MGIMRKIADSFEAQTTAAMEKEHAKIQVGIKLVISRKHYFYELTSLLSLLQILSDYLNAKQLAQHINS